MSNVEKLSRDEIRRRIGLASADNPDSEQKAADDWLAAFAKKSQEALARRDAEQKAAPRPDDKVLIERLARKDHTEYDRMRADLAETLGIRVGTLDDKVEAIRKKLAVENDEEALPHWNVEPWPEEGRRRRAARFHTASDPPLHRSPSRRRRRHSAMDTSRLDIRCRRYLTIPSAGVAHTSLRQDQHHDRLAVPYAALGNFEQHHGARPLSLHRTGPPHAADRRG